MTDVSRESRVIVYCSQTSLDEKIIFFIILLVSICDSKGEIKLLGSEMAAPVAQSCESKICNYNHKIIKLAQT